MIEELNDKNYDKMITRDDKPIFIDFYSPTCGPCQILLSYLPRISKYAEEKKVYVFKCDISKNPKIANKFMIQSVPFTIIVDKNKKVKEANNGLSDISYYIRIIDRYSIYKKQNIFKKLLSFMLK